MSVTFMQVFGSRGILETITLINLNQVLMHLKACPVCASGNTLFVSLQKKYFSSMGQERVLKHCGKF